ncbi:tetratricopeptide repeat protein [Flavobacterium ponti]|uniref:Tetratricopeptide repeat protein n=1 Tax=Flavobacterium ponti TaxID=665133 RepID=A0ABV9P3M6_9FLAO
MKNTYIFLLFFALNIFAQSPLKFDKNYIKCVDKWMVFPMNKDSVYTYGFIYIDNAAGLTFNYGGEFKINKNGDFVTIENKLAKESTSLKMRLDVSRNIIAEIPEDKFKELNVNKYPDWLEIYKRDDNTDSSLFNRGFIFNAWNECETALIYLEKLEKTNSDYEGLFAEMAFSYNHLEQYDKAEIVLQRAVKKDPKDCYTLKELAYTYKNSEKIDKNIEVYNKMVKVCKQKNFIQETAFNLAHYYFFKKDKNNFYKWKDEAKKWSETKNIYDNYLDQMTTELEK